MITREEASRNSMKISKFKLNYMKWFINRKVKKASKCGNEDLELTVRYLTGRACHLRRYIIGRMSKRAVNICLNMIAEDFKKEGFEIWCLPEDEYSSLWAERALMRIDWTCTEQEKYNSEYYAKKLHSILKAMKERNIKIIDWTLEEEVKSFDQHGKNVIMAMRDYVDEV